MHICVVSPSYPTPKTIVFVFIDQLCKAFADQGEKVTVIAPQSITRCLIHHEPVSPRHSFLKTPGGYEIELYRPYSFSMGNGRFMPVTVKMFGWAVKRAFNKLKVKPDVMYGHFWGSISAALPIAKKHCIPLFGASGEESVAFYDNYSSEQKKELCDYLSGLVNVSTKNHEECIACNLVTDDKTRIIPNAVNLSVFSERDRKPLRDKLGIKDDDFTIGFIGQFVPRKGTLRICEALKKLNDPKIKAVFIGSGVENPEYDGIVYKGRVSHDEIADYLYACDAYVMPTENEGCSNAVIEAMACGLPIVSTDAPFNYDILNESNSILVDCHNIDQIADAIVQLKANPDLKKKLSEGAKTMANKLSIDKRAERILNFIKEKM